MVPGGQSVSMLEPWRPGTGTGGLLVWTEGPHSHGGETKKTTDLKGTF